MGYAVFGRVVVDESWAPIRDVLVSVYDADPGQQSAPGQGVPGVAGDDLGTAITDESGAFRLEFEREDYAEEDGEGGPDLVVAAFAPAVARAGSVTATPRQERLLLVVDEPRADAGRSEGYVLRVSAELVAKHRLDVVDTTPGKPEPRVSFASALQQGQVAHASVQAAMADTVQPAVARRLEQRAEARNKAAQFSSLRLGQRQDPLVVPDTGSASERRQQTKAAIKSAVESGSAWLAELDFGPAIVQVDPAELLDLLPEGVDLADGPVPVSLDTVCGLIHAAAGGHKLIRTRGLLDAMRQVRDAREDAEPVENPPAEDSTEPPPTVTERLQHLVERMVADVAPGDPVDLDAPTSTLSDLQRDLAAAQLVAGPADTTAYHDFHSLQLALPDVWVEALNPDLRGVIEWMYDSFVELHRDYVNREPLAADEVSLAEIDDLEELRRSLAGEADAVEFAIARTVPPDLVALWPDAERVWAAIPLGAQIQLAALAARPFELGGVSPGLSATLAVEVAGTGSGANLTMASGEALAEALEARRAAIQGVVAGIELNATEGPITRARRLLRELSQLLTERWAFEYFAEDSSNLGIMVTYRQKWEPGPYQVGDLVATVPLAPGEQRSYEVTETLQRTRAEKEVERSVSTRSGESTRTVRATEEIIRRAEVATNFQLTAEGSISFGIGSIGATSQFAHSQQLHSQDTKSAYREAVVRASHEYRNDRTVEVAVNTEATRISKTSGELRNPNDELTVTFLLYELQRQYTVSEAIHSVTPVILVAQPMPGPGDITEAWLLQHEWILKRVLLDDSLLPALLSLTDGAVADEVSLEVKRATWEGQLKIVQRLEGELDKWTARKRELQEVQIGARQREALARSMEENQGWLGDLVENMVAYDFGDAAVDNLAAKVKAVEERMTNVQAEIDMVAEQAGNAREALQAATAALTAATEQQTQRRVNIDQLRIHIKQNILHYMQAIWGHEPPDQRYFRLYRKTVFLPRFGTATCTVRAAEPDEGGRPWPGLPGMGNVVIEACSPPRLDLTPDPEDPPTAILPLRLMVPLSQAADLDHPLGFKGNYMIFPLKDCSLITDFMIRDFVDSYFGVRDPDEFADVTTDELITARRELTLEDDEAEALENLIAARLASGRRETDTIVVPTGQMFMEALVGSHRLLEPFKLAHRGYDALRAREQLRQAGLENLRYAARLVTDEPVLGDPEVDRQILVEGAAGVHIDDGGDNG